MLLTTQVCYGLAKGEETRYSTPMTQEDELQALRAANRTLEVLVAELLPWKEYVAQATARIRDLDVNFLWNQHREREHGRISQSAMPGDAAATHDVFAMTRLMSNLVKR